MEYEKLLDYIRQDTKEKFDKVEERLNSIEDKVDVLLRFKWQIIGGSAVLSLIVAFIFQVFSTIAK